MIPIKLNTTLLAAHANILLMSISNAEERLTFCIWKILDHDRCLPTDKDLSPKGIKSAIDLSRMLKAIMLGIGKGCSCIIMT